MTNLAFDQRSQAAGVSVAIPTEAELLARARALVPVLIERARTTEAARLMSPDTIADFQAAGFFRILRPIAYGGYGMRPLTLCRVIRELARGDMSAGWISFVLGLHPYEVAIMGERACAAVWGDKDDALIASSYAPLGKMEKVAGGYRLTGTWRFSSGIDYADFITVGGMVRIAGQDRPDYVACLVPRAAVAIDTSSWNTFGLAGTGSRDFTIEDAFVPEYMTHSLIGAHFMHGQDALPPELRYPVWGLFGATVSCAVVGGALGAHDEFVARLSTRKASFDPGNGRTDLADDPLIRMRAGRATMLLRGAVYRIETCLAEMDAKIAAGEPITVEERANYGTEWGAAGEMATEATLIMFKALGARGADLASRYQSILRNVLVGSNHIGLAIDGLTLNTGAIVLGKGNSMINC